jgi:uncharacterized protein GlcG (DUF336 family)
MTTRSQDVITADGAISVIDGAVVEATRLGVAVVVSVVDRAGQLVSFLRMDGSPMISVDVATDKAWTAACFGRPTKWWADEIAKNPGLAALGNNNRLMPMPGGVPLTVAGSMVGAVGVSGASSEQDRLIAEAGAGTLAGVTFTSAFMEAAIRGYFDACNSGDAEAIAGFFIPEAVHYFPPGMYEGPFVGAETIGRRWAEAVEDLGSVWTVDQVVCDPYTARAVIEWTHFKTFSGSLLRGDEWYRFDRASGLIAEIRAYYASPQDPSLNRLELAGFDYTAGGYPMDPPIQRISQG